MPERSFRLQPVDSEISETEAAKGYDMLFTDVQRWVQQRMGPMLKLSSEDRLEPPPLSSRTAPLHALVRDPARKWTDAAGTNELHVIAIIMEYLRKKIFDRAFYCPLSDFPVDMAIVFIDEIVENMTKLRGE